MHAESETQTATERGDNALPLSGSYVIVAGEKDGRPEPEERIRGTTVRFTDDAVTVTDVHKHETFAATYSLDCGTRPCRITMTSTKAPIQGEVARGLVEKNGDQIRLIYALPGGPMPTEFKTRDKQMLFVMKSAGAGGA